VKLVEASTKKKIFVLDNINFSNLSLDKLDITRLSHFESTSVLKDGSLINNSIFLPSIVKTILGSQHLTNKDSDVSTNNNDSIADVTTATFSECIDVDSISESKATSIAGLDSSKFVDFKNLATKNSIPLKVKVSTNTIIENNNNNKSNTILQNLAIESKKGSTEDDF